MEKIIETLVTHEEKSPENILVIGSEWFSKKGGLSTFNRMLCVTLAQAGQQVYCYLPEFSEEEEMHAKGSGVSLIRPKTDISMDSLERLFKKAPLPDGVNPSVIIGHGLITGRYMKSQKEEYFPKAKTVFFVHTVVNEIEFLKPEKLSDELSLSVEKKENQQKELALSADLIACVGPHIFYETQSLISGNAKRPALFQFDPGLSKDPKDVDFRSTNITPEALLIGRIEDFHLKGVDIGLLAMHEVYNRWDILTNGYSIKPRLILRGSPVGSDKLLLDKLREFEKSNMRIQPKNYSPDMEAINEDIRKSVFVIMPSRAEGFGLVALEAISNGRPFLISEESGLAMLLKKIMPNEAGNWIIPAKPNNIQEWSDRAYEIFKDRDGAAARIQRIAEIYNSTITWKGSVTALLKAMSASSATKAPPTTIRAAVSAGDWPKYLGHGVFMHKDGEYELRRPGTDFFASRLADAFPGIRDLQWFEDPKEIVERLKILLQEPITFNKYQGRDDDVGGTMVPVWWFRAGASIDVLNFAVLSDTKCKINEYELEIEKMAVYRSGSNARHFIYLKTKAEPSVFPNRDNQANIDAQLSFKAYADESYAIYRDKIITEAEYDDGGTIIDGKPTRFVERPELRNRFLTPYNFIICAQYSVYNSTEADILMEDMLDELLDPANEDRMPQYIGQLNSLKRDRSFMKGENMF